MKTSITLKFTILIGIVLGVFAGCRGGKYLDPDVAMITNAPDAGTAHCSFNPLGAYNLSMGSWKDSSEVTYFISGHPYGIGQETTNKVLNQAFSIWGEQVEKPMISTDDSLSADIVINFDYIDGKGGTLGVSSFPPSAHGQPNVLLTFDKYDVNGVDGGSPYDFFSVALHEVGHALGFLHSANKKVVMWAYYHQSSSILDIDDVMAAKVQYGINKSFHYGKHHYIFIEHGSRRKMGQFFVAKEFFTKCRDYDQPPGHFIDSTLVEALNFVRFEVGAPIRIVSTYRPDACNRAAGGARFSQHLYCNAVDFVIMSGAARDKFMSEIKGEGCMYRTLVAMGVRGIGAYPQHNGLHIDTRDQLAMAEWGTLNPMALTDESCFN